MMMNFLRILVIFISLLNFSYQLDTESETTKDFQVKCDQFLDEKFEHVENQNICIKNNEIYLSLKKNECSLKLEAFIDAIKEMFIFQTSNCGKETREKLEKLLKSIETIKIENELQILENDLIGCLNIIQNDSDKIYELVEWQIMECKKFESY